MGRRGKPATSPAPPLALGAFPPCGFTIQRVSRCRTVNGEQIMRQSCLRILFALCALVLAAPQASLSSSMSSNVPAAPQEQQAAPQDQSEKDKSKDKDKD